MSEKPLLLCLTCKIGSPICLEVSEINDVRTILRKVAGLIVL